MSCSYTNRKNTIAANINIKWWKGINWGCWYRQTLQYRNSDRNQSKLAILQAANSIRLLSLNLCSAFWWYREKKLNLYLLNLRYWKYQKIIHRGLERFKTLSSSELGRREGGIHIDWGIMTGRRVEREAEAHNIEKPKQPKVKEQTMWDVLAEINMSWVHNDVLHWTVSEYLEVLHIWAGYLTRPCREGHQYLGKGQNCPTSFWGTCCWVEATIQKSGWKSEHTRSIRWQRLGMEGPDTWVESCLNTPGNSVMERNYTSAFQASTVSLQLCQLRVFLGLSIYFVLQNKAIKHWLFLSTPLLLIAKRLNC